MLNEPVPEATLEDSPQGKTPGSEGWFTVNFADAMGMDSGGFGQGVRFESGDQRFPEFGINVRVLQPGQPASMYHREIAQEAFLVLSGECTAIVEDEERPLRKGDFFYAAPNTAHVIVGAGNGPSSVLMAGTRKDPDEFMYPVSETARRYGASVENETDDEDEAYGDAWDMKFMKLPLPW